MGSYTCTGKGWVNSGRGDWVPGSWIEATTSSQTAVVEGERWKFSFYAKIQSNYWTTSVANLSACSVTLRAFTDPNRATEFAHSTTQLSGGLFGTDETDPFGPLIIYAAANVGTVYFEIDIDVTPINSGAGILDVDHGYITHLYEYGQFDVEDIPLLKKPVLGTLSNKNPYNNIAAVSASETSISIGYTRSGGDAESGIRYKLNGGGEVNPGHNNPFIISGLTAGTSYSISVRIGNDAGWSEWKSITIRTLYTKPTISISSKSTALEDFSISWSSNRSAQTVQYSLDGADWVTYADGINATSGTISISTKNSEDLYPNTAYKIKVRVKSTSTYDSRWSSESNTITMTTLDRARLTSSANLTFGQPLHIIKTNTSGNRNQVKIEVGNPLLLIKTQDSPSNNYNLSFSQSELDSMYRKFPNPASASLSTAQHNQIAIRVRLITYGRSRNYTVDYDGTLTLTGDALTAHTNVSGSIKRAKVWTRIGSETNTRRGVAWISTSTGVWRRGI